MTAPASTPPERVQVIDKASPVYGEVAEVVERGFHAGIKLRLMRKPVNWASDTGWFRYDQVGPVERSA